MTLLDEEAKADPKDAFRFTRDPHEYSVAELLAMGDDMAMEDFLAVLSKQEAEALRYEWEFNGRPKQQWPGKGQACGPKHGCAHETDTWTTWAVIAGRGFGKTWVGANATRRVAMAGDVPLCHLVAPTPADYRDVMIEGPAGILTISPKWERPEWFPSKRMLVWPNGARGLCFSAEDPEALRGPQCGFLWADEPGAWTYGEDTWDMAQLGLRLGTDPRQVLTTTPKAVEWLMRICEDESTHLTRGSTYENLQNLARTFARTVIKRYEGTSLGRQELLAEFLQATEGALWTPQVLQETRRDKAPETRTRVCVAVDPNVSASEDADECGIIVSAVGDDGEGYVLGDLSLPHPLPAAWARRAIAAYYRYKADAIVAEVNNGGDMVRHTIHVYDPNVRFVAVTASRGKAIRAEPVAGLFEQGRAHIVGELPELETQLTRWIPGVSKKSPDRLDALVWSLTYLMVDGPKRARLIA